MVIGALRYLLIPFNSINLVVGKFAETLTSSIGYIVQRLLSIILPQYVIRSFKLHTSGKYFTFSVPNYLIIKIFLLAFCSITAQAQTTPPPTVTTPINLCLGITATPLTATGTNLQWISPITTTVGSAIATNSSNVNVSSDVSNNRKTFFTTSVNNLVINSVDFTIPQWQSINNLRISIFNSNGQVLVTSDKIKDDGGGSGKIITVNFDYTLATAGNYSIGFSAGSGQIGYTAYSSPISSAGLTINGTTDGKRVFSNINYTANIPSAGAPIPSTSTAGSFNYYVTQTVNGITSSPATIVVNVNSPAAPVVASEIDLCQGSSASALTASGSNLNWTSSTSSSVGGTAIFGNAQYIEEKSGSNSYTVFQTLVPNVTITSVDYIIPAYQSVSKNFQIGIFKNGTLVSASSTTTNASAGSTPLTITNLFSYTITTPGEYSIGSVEGKGNIGSETSTYPMADPTGSVSITGVTSATFRIFNNIKFTVTGSNSQSTPVPNTSYVGTTFYAVTQTVNGCVSPPAIIKVNVNGVSSTTPAVAKCSGESVVLKATASDGYTLSWYAAASGGSALTSGGGITVSGGNLTISSLTTNKTYYVSATNGSCTSTRIPVQAIVGGFVWTGNSGSSSTSTGSWGSCGGNALPTSTTDITIPETTNTLTLGADLTVNSITLQGNAKINLNGKTLTVASLSGTGSIIGGANSKLVLNGSGNATLRFDQNTLGQTNALQELVINNNSRTIILENPVLVKGVVNISGSSVLVSNGNLTLESTPTSNGNIASLSNGGSIAGNVRIQTFMTGSATTAYRNFRTITPPVYDVTSPSYGYKVAGYKSTMYVTGAGGEANGFDPSPTNGATIKFYNEPQKANQNQYSYPANATTAFIKQGQGIYFYYRGKKDNTAGNKFVKVNGNYANPEDVTMEYYGIINSGNISPAITYTNNPGEEGSNGYNLIGNPYPSVIDWLSPGIIKNKIENKIWVQRQDGSFAIFDGTVGSNFGSRYILPGQGFFIKANDTSPSITFTESAKAILSAPPTRLLSAGSQDALSFNGNIIDRTQTSSSPFSKMALTLVKDEYSSDETVLVFNKDSDKGFDSKDVTYMGEGAVNLTSITPDQKYLAINYAPEISGTTEVSLYATATESGTYKLKLSDYSSMDDVTVFLKDKYLNKITEVQSEPEYEFNIDKSISSTFGGDRFKLIINPITTLPVKLLSFSASKLSAGIQLNWKTSSEQNNEYFEIQQSADGKTFFSVGKVTGAGNSTTEQAYSFTDSKPITGSNYYRLKQVNYDGLFSYSKIIHINTTVINNSQKAELVLYPNPAVNKINVSLNGQQLDDIKFNIYNLAGKKLISGTGADLDVSSLDKGVYVAEVITGLDNAPVGSYKFIKN